MGNYEISNILKLAMSLDILRRYVCTCMNV